MAMEGRTHIPIIVHEKCDVCELCQLLCPDLAITRNGNKGQIEIDYNYCKGCGICAAICPKIAIRMVLEE
jgi:pyruvate ferredoxin oxidoreductase delta subunit